MADEIVQQLGFDASAALDALARMDSALGNFDSQLSRVAESISVWNEHGRELVQVLKDIAGNANNAAAAMGKLGATFGAQQAAGAAPGQGPGAEIASAAAAVNNAPIAPKVDKTPIEDADRAAAKFVVSWETLGRVVMTQAIVRALSAMRDAMREAFESNLEFMTRVAEIQSISPGVANSLGLISKNLADLSREFNVPLAQVAEAQYQSLSNQFVSTAQQTEVMTAAFMLSKVAVMDAGQAVNLIAGTLNAYHMESSQAERVAANFFGTIQVGRVRGQELASVLGRVTAVSSELGVSLEELSAMMVTLTISGVKPAEAATALRSAMMALLKPSQDLRKELHDLGFESGQDMIAALGLEGALMKLRESTDGNMQTFAKLIPNVRAISGAMRETDDGGKRTADSMRKIQEAANSFRERYHIFIDSDAQKTISELNKLKVFLTTDLGDSIVKTTNWFLGSAGGADTLAAGIKALVPIVGVAAAGFGVFALSMGAVATSARLAAENMMLLRAGVNAALVAIVAYAAFDFTNTRIMQSFKRMGEEFQKQQFDKLDIARSANQRIVDEQNRANEAVVRQAELILAERQRAYNQMVDAAKDDNKRLTDDTHATMNKIVEEAEKEVHMLRNLANEADRAITDSAKKSAEIAGTLADTQFRWRERMWKDTGTQSEDYGKRALGLAREAEELMSKAKTPQDIQVAESFFKRAQGFAQESMALAQRSQSAYREEEAEKAIEGVLYDELHAQEELRGVKEKQAKVAADAAADEERRVTRMRELAKEVAKQMGLFDKKGELLPTADREKAIAQVKKDLEEFQGLMFASKKWEVSDWLNFDAMKRRMRETMEGAATKAEVRELFVADQTLSQLNRRISTGLGSISLEGFVTDKSILAGKSYQEQLDAIKTTIRELAPSIVTATSALYDQRDAWERIRVIQARIGGEMAAMQSKGISLWQTLAEGVNQLAPTSVRSIQTAQEEFAKISGQVEWMRAHPMSIDVKGLDALLDRLEKLKANATWSQSLPVQTAEEWVKELKQAWDYAERIRNLRSQPFQQQQEDATRGLERLRQLQLQPQTGRQVEDITDRFRQTSQSIRTSNDAMMDFERSIESAATAMQELASAAAEVPMPEIGGEMTAAHGGMAYLAGGGRPRGTDVIPAMLSPGEMVMSAATTRRFASQLTAMNAGVRPSYHSHGGHVTNIGDINVTVEGGNTGRQTARSIATELRRELRRGTSIL